MNTWVNGTPTTCAFCGQPFPIREGRVEAWRGVDGKLYCYDTQGYSPCEYDATMARSMRRPT